MNIKNYNVIKKHQKIKRYNHILNRLKMPKTCKELEAEMGMNENNLTTVLTKLFNEGYIKVVAKIGRLKVWQSVKYSYQDKNINHDANDLNSGNYIHDSDSNYFAEQYKKQSQHMRSEKKSAKVYAGGCSYDA